MNRIKNLREEYGFTQQDLADKIHGAKSTIAMYESETRKPSIEVLLKLSEIFDCSIDYILCKTDLKKDEQQYDPFGLSKLGFDMKDYNPPSEIQKQQIKSLIEVIMKENKKENKTNNKNTFK